MPLTVRGNVLSTLTRLQLLVQDGTAAAPSIAFTNRPQSGLYRAGAGAVGIAVDGVEIVRISSAGLASTFFSGNGSQLTGIGNLSVSNIQITDSGFIPLDDTAVSNSGGYLLVNGTGFTEPLGMLLGASIAPTSVTVVSQNQARVQTPAMPNGTYPLWVFTDTSSTIKNAALQVSPVPIWSTAATLANVFKFTAFTQSLVATEPLGSNITYTLSSGSSLPANVTLTSNGILSGNIVTDPGNTTTYNFSIDATDTQFQNIPRVFGLTAFTLVIVATGGTVTYSDVYTIHTFTTSGTFTLSSNPGNRTFEVLVVAGGGGGGNTNPANGYETGGGGAGGLLYNTAYALNTQSYSVTIGSGGGGSTNGGNTTLSTLTAIGGGSGASAGSAGGSGGSGGGGSHWGTAGGSGTSGQGYAGGTGAQSRGAGGGGAGQAGNTNGTGGNGLQISISGTSTYYAGGGGGSGGGVGGLGGGGSAGSFDQNGRNATGYGSGGGGAYSSASYAGGTGSPGIVIIRYRNVY